MEKPTLLVERPCSAILSVMLIFYALLRKCIIAVVVLSIFQTLQALESTVITYPSLGKNREIELFFPEGHDQSSKAPLMVLFHGGSWVQGSRDVLFPQCEYFAKLGIITVTVEYQLAAKKDRISYPNGEFKNVCIEDAHRAISHLTNQADELGADASQLVLGGNSAGGHIAFLVGQKLGEPSPAAYLLLNPAFQPDQKQHPAVDSIKNLKKKQPPIITFYGTNDKWHKGWLALKKNIDVVGCENLHYFLAKGEGHGFFKKEPWFSAVNNESARFLQKIGIYNKAMVFPENDFINVVESR